MQLGSLAGMQVAQNHEPCGEEMEQGWGGPQRRARQGWGQGKQNRCRGDAQARRPHQKVAASGRKALAGRVGGAEGATGLPQPHTPPLGPSLLQKSRSSLHVALLPSPGRCRQLLLTPETPCGFQTALTMG